MTKIEPMQIPRMTKKELKEFILGFCDNQIFTTKNFHSDHDERQLLGMVFMPIALGAFQLPEEIESLLPEQPEEPEEPLDPEHPNLEEKPTKPDFKAILPRCRAEALRLREKADWTEGWDDEHPDLVRDMRKKADSIQHSLDKRQAEVKKAWLSECRAVGRRNKKATARHLKLVAEYDRLLAEGKDLKTAYEELNAKYEEARMEALKVWTSSIGIIWEWYSKAGHRSINGYPTFFSCRVMHLKDWQKAVPIIQKEIKRREEMDLELEGLDDDNEAAAE